MVAHPFNLYTQVGEAGRMLCVGCQTGLQTKFQSILVRQVMRPHLRKTEQTEKCLLGDSNGENLNDMDLGYDVFGYDSKIAGNKSKS